MEASYLIGTRFDLIKCVFVADIIRLYNYRVVEEEEIDGNSIIIIRITTT
jgi:hypothetical protein